MAFSQPLSGSVKKGQTAMLCQLCEIEPKLKWKCLDCELLMCQRCRHKVHPKFPSAEGHAIIDIKDISKHPTDVEAKLDLTKLKCDVHTGKSCCMYCKSCQELVCQTCIAKTHNTHNFSEVEDEYLTKLENVRQMENEIKIAVQNLTNRKQQLKSSKTTEKSNYDKVKQEILDDEEVLVNEIKKHTNKLIKELDQKYKVFKTSTEDEESKLKAIESQIQTQSEQINQLLQPINAKDFFTYFDSLLIISKYKETNIPPVNTSFNVVPKFTHGDRTKIPFILGELEDVAVQYNQELQVEKTFDTDLKDLHSVVSCPDDSLWISSYNSGILHKVKPHGDTLSVKSNIKIKVYYAALLPSGDLLVSVEGSSNLKLILSGSTDIQDSVYTVTPLQPTAVHVTHDNKVIVGALGGQSRFPADGPRQVIVMDQTGHQEKVLQYDGHKNPLFTYPSRITSDRKGNIAVIDWVSKDGRGRVVVLDMKGDVRNTYTGHPDVNKGDNPFRPRGITTTPSDNFVVADICNHSLHILNSEGEIITFYNTEEMGILLPCSLSFSTTGQLYIGCYTYRDSKEKTKLFKVNNFLY